jgi:hypothetical protein
MWSNWAESAKASVTQALEKTGDVLSKAATQAGKSARAQGEAERDDEATAPSAARSYDQPTIAALPPQQQQQQQPNDILNNLSKGWSSVVETTRASIASAEAKVKEQHILLQERLAKTRGSYYKRDPTLPLDIEALKDAEVVYITDRIITMGHPASKLRHARIMSV